MAKFKVGDTVRCTTDTLSRPVVSVGFVCKVAEVDMDLICFNTDSDLWYHATRFKLVTPKPCEPKDTYTVTWVAPRKEGYTSLIDGELSFGTADEAYGFADLFCSDVDTKVTKD